MEDVYWGVISLPQLGVEDMLLFHAGLGGPNSISLGHGAQNQDE